MIKNKNFVLNLLVVIFISNFVSCDSEPPVFDKSKLIGSYTGECTILLGSKSEVVSNFPAEFRQYTQNLSFNIGDFASYESTGIMATKMASEFKDYGSYAGFTLDGFNEIFGIEQIPNFIKENISLTWDMRSMTLKLNTDSKNPPKYMIASKNLTFTYTGIIEISGKNLGENYSSPITYKFNLNKK